MSEDRETAGITRGAGQFASWDGGALLIGTGGAVVPVHAHYAIQIAFSSLPGLRFRPTEEAPSTSYDGAIIPSRQPHGMDVTAVPDWAVIFVEPETREGHALTESYLRHGIASIPASVMSQIREPLFAAWREQRSIASMADAARGVISVLTGGVGPTPVSDERILRAVSYIRTHLDAPLTLEEVAAEAFLSPSRFRHLFVEQTGMALRPYILWRRFLHVWELLMAGESLSTAAHRAGFADAAHLTRTSKRMFGFPPSLLTMTGAPRPVVAPQGQPLRSRGQPLHSS